MIHGLWIPGLRWGLSPLEEDWVGNSSTHIDYCFVSRDIQVSKYRIRDCDPDLANTDHRIMTIELTTKTRSKHWPQPKPINYVTREPAKFCREVAQNLSIGQTIAEQSSVVAAAGHAFQTDAGQDRGSRRKKKYDGREYLRY